MNFKSSYLFPSLALTFGLAVGCGIDVGRLQFAYGRRIVAKPILGCGVVLNGQRALFEPWLLKTR